MRMTKQNGVLGRVLALLMSCCLLFGLLPEAAAAAEGADEQSLFLDKWVEQNGDGFKLMLESYATGEDGTISEKPLPLDIVLVLDESGSMEDVLIHGCNDENGTDVEVTPRGHLADGIALDESQMNTVLFVGHKIGSKGSEEINTSKTYTVVYPADGTTRNISYCTDCQAWFSNTNHEDHPHIAEWIPFKDEEESPAEPPTDDTWTCTV